MIVLAIVAAIAVGFLAYGWIARRDHPNGEDVCGRIGG
jgi:hypothetical protein